MSTSSRTRRADIGLGTWKTLIGPEKDSPQTLADAIISGQDIFYLEGAPQARMLQLQARRAFMVCAIEPGFTFFTVSGMDFMKSRPCSWLLVEL